MLEKEFNWELEKWFLSQKKPFFISFELTHKCNLRCVHCLLKKNIKNEELSLNDIKKVLDEIAELETLYIALTGGEIFIRKDIIPILQYIAKKKFLINIKTNGSLITKKIVNKIKNLPIARLDLSLYGASKKTYKEITGNGNAFNATMNALFLLKKAKIPVIVGYCPLKKNFKEAYMIKEIAIKNGFGYATIPYIRPRQDGSKTPLKHSCSHSELMNHVPFFRNVTINKEIDKQIKINPYAKLCNAGSLGINIDPYGNVSPCIEWRRAYAGNIRKTSIKKIWYFSKKLEWVRSLRFKDLKDCQKCKFLDICSICPPRALKCEDWYKKYNLLQMRIIKKSLNSFNLNKRK